MGADAVEVANSDTFDLQSALWARQTGLLSLMGGSDTHSPTWGYYGFTALALNASDFNTKDRSRKQAAVMAELVAGRTTVLFDAKGSPHRTWPPSNDAHLWLTPLRWVRALVEGMLYNQDKGMYDFNGGYCADTILNIYWAAIGGCVIAGILTFCLVTATWHGWRARAVIYSRCALGCRWCCEALVAACGHTRRHNKARTSVVNVGEDDDDGCDLESQTERVSPREPEPAP
jgi:hypothetical protein